MGQDKKEDNRDRNTVENVSYDYERNQRSSGKDLHHPSKNCAKIAFSSNEDAVIPCQKLIKDFRFLLNSESYHFGTAAFPAKCYNLRKLNSSDYLSPDPKYENVTRDSNMTSFKPHFRNIKTTKIRPGTITKMMFNQMEQSFEKLTSHAMAPIFHRKYSKLVIFQYLIALGLIHN